MSDDRLRIPQDSNYFHAIGLAVVVFARLEWDALWCCERLAPGYINTIEPQKKTAGMIAVDLKQLFLRVSDIDMRSKIIPFGVEFEAIVQERNGLLHGKPRTAPNGDQRLVRHAVEWTIDAVNEFSDRCVRAGMPLNALLFNELKEPCTVALNPA